MYPVPLPVYTTDSGSPDPCACKHQTPLEPRSRPCIPKQHCLPALLAAPKISSSTDGCSFTHLIAGKHFWTCVFCLHPPSWQYDVSKTHASLHNVGHARDTDRSSCQTHQVTHIRVFIYDLNTINTSEDTSKYDHIRMAYEV